MPVPQLPDIATHTKSRNGRVETDYRRSVVDTGVGGIRLPGSFAIHFFPAGSGNTTAGTRALVTPFTIFCERE
jgi:hypothetical protein